MNRREFIRGPATTGLVAVAAASLPLRALASPSPIYKCGKNGCVMCSDDDGATWREVLDLGPDCRVLEIRQHGGILSCRVTNGPHGFSLYSRDGRNWATDLKAARTRRVARRLKIGRDSRNNLSTVRV
jgi:hypothetical protein